MEDKVASKVGNLVLNIMYALLKLIICHYNWRSTCFNTMQLTSSDGVKCVTELETAGEGVKGIEGFLLKSFFMGADSLNLGFNFSSGLGSGLGSGLDLIMIGLVPCATPQTFSRMVVFPALALPMTRIRK